jgi:beta-N-acetylhexosaminidase
MSDRIETIMQGMSLEQRVGQMLCYGLCGNFAHRDVLEVIEKYHVAGLRVTPSAKKFSRYFGPDHPGTPRCARDPELYERVYNVARGEPTYDNHDWIDTANRLRQASLESCNGVPLYMSLDYEGNVSGDYFGPGMVGIPHPMGLVASGDPSLCYRVGKMVAAQLKAAGIDWVHSPDLDVNTVPNNPEIGTRAFAPEADTIVEYALEYMRGYEEGRLVCSGKHFPGRGHSASDAHFGIPTIEESAERMREVHLAPYRALIAAGMPSIMLAHSVYPALDPTEEISTVSKAIVTGVLREELGFEGVILTDSFTMGGLVARYEVAEAAVRSFEAGVDLILLKDENALRGEVFQATVDAVRSGRLSEERINASVRRVLSVKERYGILDAYQHPLDADQADRTIRDPAHQKVGKEAAEKSVVVMRDDAGLLPLPKGKRVLVVEQHAGAAREKNTRRAYTGALYHALLDQGYDAIFTDYTWDKLDELLPVIQERASHADIVVATCLYQRGQHIDGQAFEKLAALNKPLVVVSNSPYPETISPKMKTVLVNFSTFANSMHAAAAVLTGEAKPQAKLHFDPLKTY